MSDFVHLHVHTQYSLLDGMNRSNELIEKVSNDGMDAVAITDHGVMYGVPEFWMAAKDHNVKPIIGVEAYLAPKSRTLRKAVDGIKYYHLLLLAKNLTGYRNIVKMVTESHLSGMYYKPRIDMELLKKYNEGVICTSACLAGPLATHIVNNQLDIAEGWLKKLHHIFGDDFYLEIQRNGLCQSDQIDHEAVQLLPESEKQEKLRMLKEQMKVNKQLYKWGDKYKIPVVATTDAHFLNPEDKEIQKVLFCIRDGKQVDDPDALDGYLETYIKTSEELRADFADVPEVMEETLKISEKVEEYDITFDRVQPQFWNLPQDTTAKAELKKQTFEGAKQKYGEITPELEERLNHELKVIHDKGYDDYFLVVSDIMKWAARQDILTGVRGSVAGSAVGHCLDIVAVDPIKWELYFERFLNPERPSPPDIDMDIQDSRRDELIDYVKEKYGEESIAAICAIGRLKTKAAIRDVARVMGVDLGTADKLSKMVTVLFGRPFSFNKMMETDEEFKKIVESDTQLQELGNTVSRIEGLARHMSVHACGYLVTPGPINEYTPLQLETGGDKVITQLEGPWIEEIGLMKFDFLGLRTLTIVSTAIELVEKRYGNKIDFWNIPEDDEATFELMASGETTGVFQFESPPMQRYLRDLQPTTQEDLCFLAAAYRPGPMKYIPDYIDIKHGRKEATYLIPELKPILEKTNGYAIYQEQVMRIAVDLAGYTMGAADKLRRAMGKKKVKIMEKEEPKFKKGIKDLGYDQSIADELWEYLLPFADYGFNKAHAAGYAVLAYKSAYLKAHYPLEFMTALMHSDLENSDRITIDIQEAERMGFEVLPPDINTSDVHFEPQGEKTIRFGLGAIKNVGVSMCEEIIAARAEQGEFQNLDDFIEKVGTEHLNKRAVECLIKAGALDEFGPRNGLLAILPSVFDKINHKQKISAIGQTDMFGLNTPGDNSAASATKLPNLPELTDRQLIQWEKELMGIFLSRHPLDNYFWVNLLPDFDDIAEIHDLKEKTRVKVIANITETKVIRTKANNEKMAFLTLDGGQSTIEAVLFPSKFELYEEDLSEAVALVFTGSVSHRNDKASILINSISPADNLRPPNQVTINICDVTNQADLSTLKKCLDPEGELEVKIKYGKKFQPKTLVKKIPLEKKCLQIIQKYSE